MPKNSTTPKSKGTRRGRFRLLRRLLPPTLLLLSLWYLLPLAFPLPADLSATPRSPNLLDRHGTPLHRLTLPDFTRSSPVSLAEIPPDLIACTLAAEDKRFRSHGGIDLLATARAAQDWISHGHAISGASTITQQLIKLSTPNAPRSLKTKLHEALLARHLEMSWSKDQILIAYLNHLDYGSNRLGPTEAARFFFQKPLADLSLGECALLAGLPQAPSRLNPIRHPERALKRRSTVLTRLSAGQIINSSRISAAAAEPLQLHPLKQESIAPWLPQFSQLSTSEPGADIPTTLDASLQFAVEQIVSDELAPLRGFNLHHAAVVVIHNPSREVLALVSSGNWDDPRDGQINGALSPRSPGSALKPFTYLLSFENGAAYPGSIIADIPTRFRTEEGLDAPQNYDHHFRGPVTIRRALACSLNVPAMRQLNALGGPRPLYQILTQLGIATLGPDPASYGLGLTLGNAPVTLLDLTNAYATLARGGRHRSASFQAISPAPPEPRLFSSQSAYLIADILADPAARVPSFGPNSPLQLPFPCAAKTGTSSDFRDNWCLGFTPEFTVGVWAGNFDNSPMKGLSGVAGAGPIFHRCMAYLAKQSSATWYQQPAKLLTIRIDPRSGKSLENWPSQAAHQPTSTTELCPVTSPPLPAAPSDYDSDGRYLLDANYREWLNSAENLRRDQLALAPDSPALSPLRILAPRPESTYIIDPELPNGGRLHLATNLPGLAEWSCSTLSLTPGDPEPTLLLAPGTHQLIATDPRTGQSTTISLLVKTR